MSTPTHVPPAQSFELGDHLMGGFEGLRAGDAGVEALRELAERGHIGGVVLFSYNVESPDQVRDLTRYMLSWNIPERRRPLLVGVDQEGGKVQRLAASKGFAARPSQAALAAMSDPEISASCDAMAAELASAGIHINFAPVVDVAPPFSLMGQTQRSFGADAERVSRLAKLCVDAHRKHGVVAAAKHFPGLGSCVGDTHEDLADTTDTWRRDELIPYQSLIDMSGLQAIMSTHMVNARLSDGQTPLTFERRVMHDMLRDGLHFQGVLFTDDLGMGSIVRHYDIEHVVVESLRSGHDMLVFGQNAAAAAPGTPARHQAVPHLYDRAQRAIEQALQTKRLRAEDLEQSASRLATLRAMWRSRS